MVLAWVGWLLASVVLLGAATNDAPLAHAGAAKIDSTLAPPGAMIDAPLAQPRAAPPADAGAATDDMHVLRVPYRNQLDGSPYAQANCGPTSLAMMLAYHDVEADTWDLRVRSMKAQRSWVHDEGGYSHRYGVFVYILAQVAEELGFEVVGLWEQEGRRFDRMRRWEPADVRRQLAIGRPVIVQVEYRALPGNAGSSYMNDHYVVVHGTRGDEMVYSDPLGRDGRGPGERISDEGLRRAMHRASSPGAAFAIRKR